jgi:hypothetical protein
LLCPLCYPSSVPMLLGVIVLPLELHFPVSARKSPCSRRF